ncbi:MAG: hypothetical protein GY842_09605 [bacterium]|nr:hypothetical protein [bacterium]
MFEHFSDRARRVMARANHEAGYSGRECICADHILLGLLDEEGVGVAALRILNVNLRSVKLDLEKVTGPRADVPKVGRLPLDAGAKKVIEWAIEEARGLRHNYVGTEHLLLGLLHNEETVAGQVLIGFVEMENVRAGVLEVLGQGPPLPAEAKLPRASTINFDRFADDLLLIRLLEFLDAHEGRIHPVVRDAAYEEAMRLRDVKVELQRHIDAALAKLKEVSDEEEPKDALG